jgi:glutathione synthase
MKILILTDSFSRIDENHSTFANSFLDKGWEVFYGMVNSFSSKNYKVYCDVIQVISKVPRYGSVTSSATHQHVEDYDLIWMMSHPHPNLAKDIWQILWMLSKRVQFVNSVEAMVFLNNKNNLGLIVPPENQVEIYVSNEYTEILSHYDQSDRRWIVKPTNSGCGADVYLLEPGDSNAHAILQSMTGNVSAIKEIHDVNSVGLQNKYCLLQGYVSQVEKNEKRVIIAGGAVIAQYGRVSNSDDHRANISQGGNRVISDLSSEETNLCSQVAQSLRNYGANFAGLDIAYPYILEVNVINPGGIFGIYQMTGTNFSEKAIACILKSLRIADF